MLSIVAFDLTTTSSFEDVRPPVLDAQLHAPFGFAYIPVVPDRLSSNCECMSKCTSRT